MPGPEPKVETRTDAGSSTVSVNGEHTTIIQDFATAKAVIAKTVGDKSAEAWAAVEAAYNAGKRVALKDGKIDWSQIQDFAKTTGGEVLSSITETGQSFIDSGYAALSGAGGTVGNFMETATKWFEDNKMGAIGTVVSLVALVAGLGIDPMLALMGALLIGGAVGAFKDGNGIVSQFMNGGQPKVTPEVKRKLDGGVKVPVRTNPKVVEGDKPVHHIENGVEAREITLYQDDEHGNRLSFTGKVSEDRTKFLVSDISAVTTDAIVPGKHYDTPLQLSISYSSNKAEDGTVNLNSRETIPGRQAALTAKKAYDTVIDFPLTIKADNDVSLEMGKISDSSGKTYTVILQGMKLDGEVQINKAVLRDDATGKIVKKDDEPVSMAVYAQSLDLSEKKVWREKIHDGKVLHIKTGAAERLSGKYGEVLLSQLGLTPGEKAHEAAKAADKSASPTNAVDGRNESIHWKRDGNLETYETQPDANGYSVRSKRTLTKPDKDHTKEGELEIVLVRNGSEISETKFILESAKPPHSDSQPVEKSEKDLTPANSMIYEGLSARLEQAKPELFQRLNEIEAAKPKINSIAEKILSPSPIQEAAMKVKALEVFEKTSKESVKLIENGGVKIKLLYTGRDANGKAATRTLLGTAKENDDIILVLTNAHDTRVPNNIEAVPMSDGVDGIPLEYRIIKGAIVDGKLDEEKLLDNDNFKKTISALNTIEQKAKTRNRFVELTSAPVTPPGNRDIMRSSGSPALPIV